jgi:ABC-2 type transport system permease protein
VTTLSLGMARADVELRTFFRQRDVMIFTFALPAVIMTVLCSVFGQDDTMGTVTVAQHLAAGLIAGGIASTSFVNLAEGITTDRNNGALKRLHGMPLPVASYFLGKVALVLVASLAEVTLMLTVATMFFHVSLPHDAGHWVTFGWLFLLGVGACSLLGIALSSLVRSTSGAAAMANLALIVLQFISGVYVVPITKLPAPMTAIASLFPLKWMAQGLRAVFLPDSMAAQELAGTWEHGRTAIVLVAWCIGGLALCLLTFRWRGRTRR